jgi:molecular chaperone GrpE
MYEVMWMKKRSEEKTKQEEAKTPMDQADGLPQEDSAPIQEEADAEDEQPTAAFKEEYQQLEKDLEQSRQQATQNLEGWQRERAEFSNYKRRIEREQAQMAQNITAEVIRKYLVILDDLERALKARPEEREGAAWAQGIELIYRKLQNVLEAEGVIRIQAETEMFNPNIHEAISHEESPEHESGDIIEVVQQGYKIGERIIRPALVRVAR